MAEHSAVLTAEKRADEKAVLWAVYLVGLMVDATEIQKAGWWVAWMAARSADARADWTDFLMAVQTAAE